MTRQAEAELEQVGAAPASFAAWQHGGQRGWVVGWRAAVKAAALASFAAALLGCQDQRGASSCSVDADCPGANVCIQQLCVTQDTPDDAPQAPTNNAVDNNAPFAPAPQRIGNACQDGALPYFTSALIPLDPQENENALLERLDAGVSGQITRVLDDAGVFRVDFEANSGDFALEFTIEPGAAQLLNTRDFAPGSTLTVLGGLQRSEQTYGFEIRQQGTGALVFAYCLGLSDQGLCQGEDWRIALAPEENGAQCPSLPDPRCDERRPRAISISTPEGHQEDLGPGQRVIHRLEEGITRLLWTVEALHQGGDCAETGFGALIWR